MFPVSDDDSQRRTLPVVTYILIVLNVLFFLVELSAGDQFIQKWAFIPARFSADPGGNAATILTAMFMHGGWLHLFSNMLFLWMFGDNVEDRFGHFQFLIFYLIVGVAATFA
jgi:membrane associated rhomboid family serine protease